MSTKTIAMVVLNSISHDARVKKSAESLSKNAYKVFIIGIRDNRDSRPMNFLPNGTKVVRVDIQTAIKEFKTLIRSFFWAICLITLTLVIYALSITWMGTFLATTTINLDLIIAYIMWVGIAFSLYFFIKSILIYNRFYYLFRGKYPPTSKAQKTKIHIFLPKHIEIIMRTKTVFTKFIKRRMTEKVVEWKIGKEILKIKPDVVHCHDLNTLPIGCKIKKKTNCTIVYDSHEIYEHISQLDRPTRFYYQWVQKRCSKLVDHFITINDSIREYLNQKYPSLPPGVVVKNATLYQQDLPNYDGRLHEKVKLKQKVQILLYQGGFARHRGLEALVLSAPHLKDGWVLVMMGWGKLENELKAIAERIDPEQKKIRFIPAVPQKELVYWTQGATLGIIPYENICLNHWYCSPNKLWEYPNAGVPAIVSSFPEMKKTVIENNIGWLLGKLTPEAIAQTVNAITENDLAIKREACRNFVSSDNWSYYETRLLNLYRTLFSEARNSAIVAN